MATTTAQLKLDSAAGSLLTSVVAIDDTMTLYDYGTTTGMTKTTGLARLTIAAATETKLLDASDYTSTKGHQLYIKNTDGSGTETVKVTVGDVGSSKELGYLGFDEWSLMPWGGNEDINITCTSASTIVEWMLIFE
jgi:hypothetical protein